MTQVDIGFRIEEIHKKIARAAERAGRDPAQVTVLGACKQVERERVLQAIALGIGHVGENWIQEAEAKFKGPDRPDRLVSLHLIGHLQTNKVRSAVALFDVVQSVDSVRLASRMETIANELDRHVQIYIQLNVGSEPTKEGVRPDQVLELAEFVATCEHLELVGLMAVPPHLEDLEAVRPYFRVLRELRDGVCRLEHYRDATLGLSMGMTEDFEIAVEEGATMVRLGSAIWGARPT
ncbi:MAG: YggS family pyridoxal phosphate-dependent enzyme [Chloroflexi bacterium]|nr:YggS family pyridoxal phosphate-dependent enzyme [Chloroflexota bacterium]